MEEEKRSPIPLQYAERPAATIELSRWEADKLALMLGSGAWFWLFAIEDNVEWRVLYLHLALLLVSLAVIGVTLGALTPRYWLEVGTAFGAPTLVMSLTCFGAMLGTGRRGRWLDLVLPAIVAGTAYLSVCLGRLIRGR